MLAKHYGAELRHPKTLLGLPESTPMPRKTGKPNQASNNAANSPKNGEPQTPVNRGWSTPLRVR
jgi:hypothetical protein